MHKDIHKLTYINGFRTLFTDFYKCLQNPGVTTVEKAYYDTAYM